MYNDAFSFSVELARHGSRKEGNKFEGLRGGGQRGEEGKKA